MKTSSLGVAFITHHEGCILKPYKDAIGLWTVGIGHLIGDGKSLPANWNRPITKEDAINLLRHDLRRFEQGVERLCPIKLTQTQFDALVSFSFNLGLGNLQISTLRKKVNRGDFYGAAREFLKWNKAGGRVLRGLTRRRNEESMMFMGRYNG